MQQDEGGTILRHAAKYLQSSFFSTKDEGDFLGMNLLKWMFTADACVADATGTVDDLSVR